MKINATKHKMPTLWPLGLRYSFNGIILLAVFLLLLTLAAHFFFSESAQSVLTNLFINLIAVLGMCMFIGTTGVPSFGHVAFMGIAAHLQALLTLFVGFLWIAQRGSVDPHIGLNPTIKAFIAVIFSGVGSLSGAVAGGLILGFMEVGLRTYLPADALPFRDAIGYMVVVLVLLRWPDGLISIRQNGN